MPANLSAGKLESRVKYEVSPRVAADIAVRKEEGIDRNILGCWGVT